MRTTFPYNPTALTREDSPCPECRSTDFVRFEREITGGRVTGNYYCGACDFHWRLIEHDPYLKAPNAIPAAAKGRERQSRTTRTKGVA